MERGEVAREAAMARTALLAAVTVPEILLGGSRKLYLGRHVSHVYSVYSVHSAGPTCRCRAAPR